MMAAGLCWSGCAAFDKDSAISHHLDDHPRETAKSRWDNVRGDVTLQLAQQHYRAGRLKDAETELSKVLALSPDNSEVYMLAARLYLELGQLSKAQEAVVAAARLPGYDAETEYLAGIIAERYGMPDKALSHYKTALTLKPNVPEYVLATAEMYVASDAPDKAMALLQTRLRDFDGCNAMIVLAAKVARVLDLRDEAVGYCRDALQENANDDLVRAELAAILVWAERYSEAIQSLQPMVDRADGTSGRRSSNDRSVKRSALPSSVRTMLAAAYMGTGQFAEARRTLRGVMSRDPADPGAWCLFVRASILDGDLDSADEAILRFNRRNEPSPESLLLAGYVAYLQGRMPDAVNAAEAALKRDPHMEAAWLLSIQASQVRGAMREARENCRRALAENPNSRELQAVAAAFVQDSAASSPASPTVKPPSPKRECAAASGSDESAVDLREDPSP